MMQFPGALPPQGSLLPQQANPLADQHIQLAQIAQTSTDPLISAAASSLAANPPSTAGLSQLLPITDLATPPSLAGLAQQTQGLGTPQPFGAPQPPGPAAPQPIGLTATPQAPASNPLFPAPAVDPASQGNLQSSMALLLEAMSNLLTSLKPPG